MIYRIFHWLGLNRQQGQQTGNRQSYGGTQSTANVTFESAMTVSAFWASVRLLSETIGSLDIKCYKIQSDGTRIPDTNYKVWRLLRYSPNRYQTCVEFQETLTLQLVTTGNFYGAVERDGRGYPISILPLMSAQMTPELLKDGSVIYQYYDSVGNVRVYSADSIMHIKLFGNGIVGLSPLSYAAKSIGVSIDSDNRAAKLAASGGKTNGVLMVDRILTPEQRAQTRRNFAELTEGSEDQLFVLEADMKYERTSLSPQDMQLLETRRFQLEDVARFMGVPSVLINDTSGTTAWGSGIQQILMGFYKLGLTPYNKKIISSYERSLMPLRDRGEYELDFDFDQLLEADLATRLESYGKGINGGNLTPNEARARERLPAKEGGDNIYLNGTLVPANMIITGSARENAQRTESDQQDS
jgi:HK97 family phage portal protein